MTTPVNDDRQLAVARIHAAVRRIPAGWVATYGDVADAAGLPGRARLVGRSLGAPVDGEPLPWHRVIAASGRIALPPGSASYREQCSRLLLEGIAVNQGRVDLRRHRWRRHSPAPVLD